MSENERQFQMAMHAYLASAEVSIGDLRAYGRVIGVDKPTTKVKTALIEEITLVLLGELKPIPQSTRGAPVKNNFVKPTVLNTINKLCADYHIFDKYPKPEPYRNPYDVLWKKPEPMVMRLESPEIPQFDRDPMYVGQLQKLNGVHYLLPLDCRDGNKILISEKMIEENELIEGDVVKCWTAQGQNLLVVTEVLTVNDVLIKSFDRRCYEEITPCYPKEPLVWAGKAEKNAALKYFGWVAPIYKGHRACIIAPPKAGKSQLIYDMAVAAKRRNPTVDVYVLLVEQSPEAVGKFRRVFAADKLIYTTYEDDADRQVFTAEFLMKRLKRQVEHGKDILLFVDSVSALARAYNDTDASLGGKTLAGGLESKTLQYVKRFLATARCMEQIGSLTIVGAVSSNTGNPADDLICSELTSVANFEVRLSDALAIKRIFPSIDPMQTKLGEGVTATEEDAVLRTKYLPRFGVERFVQTLQEQPTKEDFVQALQNSIEA